MLLFLQFLLIFLKKDHLSDENSMVSPQEKKTQKNVLKDHKSQEQILQEQNPSPLKNFLCSRTHFF